MKIYEQKQKIKEAYDATVKRRNQGIEDESLLPNAFKKSERYKKFKERAILHSTNSDNPNIMQYLNPNSGMKFLDIGSNVNLITRDVANWPSLYYGIDISPELIRVTKKYVEKHTLIIGGLFEAGVDDIPFEDDFFDIAAAIGVLEYFDLSFIEKSLREISRVLKSETKFVVDMPNLKNPHTQVMIELETYLGRPSYHLPSKEVFENELNKFFVIEEIEDNEIMTTYFTRVRIKCCPVRTSFKSK